MGAVAVLMTCFELGEGHRAQTGIEVEIQCGLCTSLAIAQPGTLCGVATQKFDLKTRLVIAVEPQGFRSASVLKSTAYRLRWVWTTTTTWR